MYTKKIYTVCTKISLLISKNFKGGYLNISLLHPQETKYSH